jgi:hypothetical protein
LAMNFGGRFNARHPARPTSGRVPNGSMLVVGISGKAAALGSCTTLMLPGARAGRHPYRSVRAGEIGPDLFHAASRRGLEGLIVEAPRPSLSGWAVEALGEGQQPGSACDRRREGRRPKLGAPQSGPRYRSVGLRFVVCSIRTCIALLSSL